VSQSTEIVVAVLSFLVLLALVSLVRSLLRRESPWRQLRVGVFIEREQQPHGRWPGRSEDDTKVF
jgi:hypothetical protein